MRASGFVWVQTGVRIWFEGWGMLLQGGNKEFQKYLPALFPTLGFLKSKMSSYWHAIKAERVRKKQSFSVFTKWGGLIMRPFTSGLCPSFQLTARLI